ncbi:Cation efflux system protein CusB precursor [Caulifigura coniformis]|uniref:Cation efflux system protein CusB n=1 Tax=Caulifigura coniformis TaxID=2527983 RepID=A0A517S9H7_9PLAN|nr:efflux RND transporter periplasmic adaptor subunit [Caulifigura coniformis]QDT52762.1 Cation efflux system protein CusB precursor [Caulifigura coniformis]
MKWKPFVLKTATGLGLLAGLVALIAWWPKATGKATTSDTWTCSMHPQIRLPNPGPCPICGMQLIPVSQLPNAREDLETRAGLEVEQIQTRKLFKEIRTVGKLDYSERQVELITARVAGRVDRVYADFTGLDVKKGDHLVSIYSPELYSAQNELLLGLDAKEKEKATALSPRSLAESRLEASRTKLRLLGILDEQIKTIESTREIAPHLTIYAPLGGTVIEKNIRVGQYVDAGDQLYRIANLDPIWLYLNIYEYDVAWVRFGQAVDITLEAFPGETFHGTVTFIDPFLDDATRTIRVRVNIKNTERLLKPQMFATATIHVGLGDDGTPEPTGLEGMYVCPMHPEVKQPDPGKCPFCEMPLEKVPERRRESRRERAAPGPSPSNHRHAAGSPDQTVPTQSTDPTPPAVTPTTPSKQTHVGHEEHKDAPPLTQAPAGDGLLAIPVSAVLDTGRRRITYRLTGAGAYELVELKLGPRARSTDESGKEREYFLVLEGVTEADRVVTQSGFLLDSQRQIEGMPSLLFPTGQSGTNLHAGHGGQPNPAPAAAHQH